MNTLTTSRTAQVEIKDFEKDFSDLVVLSMEEYCEKYGNIIINPHRISFYQTFIIAEGEGRIWKDSNEYKYFQKSLFTITKGQVATFEYDEVPKGYVILFSEEFINRNPGDLDWLNNLNLFDLAMELPISSLTGLEYFELLVFIRKIKLELESHDDYVTGEIIFSLFKTFILVVERLNTKRMNFLIKEPGDKTYVYEFKKKLESMYNNSRTVNYYADQLGITPRKLNQVTFNFCGVSAKQLIEDRVLLETKRLLVHTQMTIKEIGHSLGFNDPTNFNKFFKRYIKLTPLEFRDLNKKTGRINKTADNDHFQSISLVDN
jgi:AraC family transcriptional regulator, transcriptional activator of pobA